MPSWQVFGSISPFSQASNLVQYALTVVLSDLDWVDAWVAENQRQLALSYSAFSGAWRGCDLRGDSDGRL